MTETNFAAIEKKWQDKWDSEKIFEVTEDSSRPKYYILEMFPYPSGTGIHMGHAFNYTLGDIIARYKILNGFNVLHPMGFDSLGLPAENAAIKDGTHPEDYTNNSIPNFVKQQKTLGLTYDWSRVLSTADPAYYKWDQWIFLKMLEKGLAYQKTSAVNWCPKCQTVLANEQVVDGNCWRHEETPVEVKHLKQWFLKITDYADELFENIKNLDWPDKTKAMQKNWIGKSHGTEIDFEINGEFWPVFTTRPDTIFGVTFVVVAAAHKKLMDLVTPEQEDAVKEFLKKLGSVSEKELADMDKVGVFTGSYAINPATNEKVPIYAGNFVVADYGSGMVMAVPAHDQRDFEFAKKYDIEIKQVIAPSFLDEKNPPRKGSEDTKRNIIHAILLNENEDKFVALKHKKFPWVTPITGGIDQGESPVDAAIREIKEETGYQNFKLVKEMNHKMHARFYAAHKEVNRSVFSNALVFKLEDNTQEPLCEEEDCKHEVTWMPVKDLEKLNPVSELPEILKWFKNGESAYTDSGILINSGEFNDLQNSQAKEKITEWLNKKGSGRKVTNFRLRDWGISRQRYWGTPIPVIHCDDCGAVPVPETDLPVQLPKDVEFGNGNPLETAKDWYTTHCPKCGKDAKRETDTMDTFVNSSWYFTRYCDPNNDNAIFEKDKANYWCPIDTYIGGAEHACMHLIYSRFYTKFLRDLGLLNFDEPAKRLLHQGMINGSDGEKMSKSKGNGVEPLETMEKYGVDTTRFFLVSVASPDKGFNWSDKGIAGSLRFVNKLTAYFEDPKFEEDSESVLIKLNKTIKNTAHYYENFEYRKATIELRELFDVIEKNPTSKESLEKFLKILNPICPHLTEEFYEKLGNKKFISNSDWPNVEEIKEKKKSSTSLNEKIIERINEIKKNDTKKVYIYIMPFEKDKINSDAISSEVNLDVEVFTVNNSDKYDPQNKAKKAKPGMPSIYLE